ncbi:undecaprenyldiphospho-muramoylpentapeptide beta-N-acetylglucosaminyltransferase [Candidatus Cloacimonadota bacterium]
MKKVLIAAGGSGGHIIPALSIAAELQKRDCQIHYIGNFDSMEERLVHQEGITFSAIDVQKIYRKLTFAHFRFPYKLLKSIKNSRTVIQEFVPDAFLGTGGFVSGPVGYAAHLEKVPIFLQEQNSYPGLTTRILSKWSDTIFLGNRQAEKYFVDKRVIHSGNPIKKDIMDTDEKLDFTGLGLREDTVKVLILGGSQGSVAINKVILDIVDKLLKMGIEIIWQIGKYSYSEISQKIKGKQGIYYFDFTNEIGRIYNSVDMAITRAGAISIAEMESKQIPCLFIPLPTAAENHQYHNAKEQVDNGTARIIEQKHFSRSTLLETMKIMLKEKDKMKSNFKQSSHLKAAENIAAEIVNRIQR